jgi:hypothetical protein
MASMWKKIALTMGLVAMNACTDGAAVPGEGDDSTQTPYLFGLTEAELRAIYPLAAGQHDEASWLAFNRAPFECSRYGDLCRMVGEQAAEDITREALYAALEGADLAAVAAEMDRRTEAARVAYVSPAGGRRGSDVDTVLYGCGNHRLRIETFKVNPAFGARYGQVNCKHQADLGSGIWGGTQTADQMWGHVEILGSNPLEEADASQTDVHSLTTPKVYPGLNQTVRGRCTGDHNGDVVDVLEDRS